MLVRPHDTHIRPTWDPHKPIFDLYKIHVRVGLRVHAGQVFVSIMRVSEELDEPTYGWISRSQWITIAHHDGSTLDSSPRKPPGVRKHCFVAALRVVGGI